VPFARDADALAVVDPRRDLDVECPLLDHAAVTTALATWSLDDPAAARAGRAGVRADELAESAARDLAHAPCAATRRAARHGRARLGSLAAAVRARDGGRKRHMAADSCGGFTQI